MSFACCVNWKSNPQLLARLKLSFPCISGVKMFFWIRCKLQIQPHVRDSDTCNELYLEATVPRLLFFFLQKQVMSDFKKKKTFKGSKEIRRNSWCNDASWKSRWELQLDCHYRIRIGRFCHFGDLRCSFVVLSLPASKKGMTFPSYSHHSTNVHRPWDNLKKEIPLTFIEAIQRTLQTYQVFEGTPSVVIGNCEKSPTLVCLYRLCSL